MKEKKVQFGKISKRAVSAWLAGFSERVRVVREKAGISQSDLSALLGKASRESVARLERGEAKQISVLLLMAIFHLTKQCGFSAQWLITGEGPELDRTEKLEEFVKFIGESGLLDRTNSEGETNA